MARTSRRKSGDGNGAVPSSRSPTSSSMPLADVHGEGVPRLLDVRHPRPRAAAPRGRPEAGAAADRLRDVRAGALGQRQAQEVGAHGGRRDRQVPSARRLACYEAMVLMAQPFSHALSAGRRPGELGLAGRSEVVRGHALHRGAADAVRADRCSPSWSRARSTGGRTSTARSKSRSCCRRGCRTCCSTAPPASPSAWPPTSRRTTCARWSSACIRAARRPRSCRTTQLYEAHQGPRLPDRRRRSSRRAAEIREIYETGYGLDPHARHVGDGGRRHRHHRPALPGLRQQGPAADRRADAGQEAADGRGPARRVRPREPDAPGDHAALEPGRPRRR